MLPPGHIAGGFLAAYGLLKATNPALDTLQIHRLLILGAIFGFLPDMDYFISFAKEKSLTVRDFEKNNHRQYLSHAPLLWMAAGLAIYFLAGNLFVKFTGLVLWLSSWSHFILDTFEYGVMWLWPFSRQRIYLMPQENKNITVPGFWKYWMKFVKGYLKTVSFYLELVVILITIYILILKF
jgi:hypothetical protein